MTAENLEEISSKGDRIRDMVQNCPGWLDFKELIREMRMEAFNEWSGLPLTATPQDAMAIRAKEVVLGSLMERLEDLIRKSDEAKEDLIDREFIEQQENKEKAARLDLDKEFNDLMRPLPIFATTPRSGPQS